MRHRAPGRRTLFLALMVGGVMAAACGEDDATIAVYIECDADRQVPGTAGDYELDVTSDLSGTVRVSGKETGTDFTACSMAMDGIKIDYVTYDLLAPTGERPRGLRERFKNSTFVSVTCSDEPQVWSHALVSSYATPPPDIGVPRPFDVSYLEHGGDGSLTIYILYYGRMLLNLDYDDCRASGPMAKAGRAGK